MAFTVTPTAGDAPYVLNATFDNIASIDFINYSLELRSSSQVGSCFMDVSEGPDTPSISQSLLASGSATLLNSVPAGSCSTRSLIIRDLSTNAIIESQNVYIDNT